VPRWWCWQHLATGTVSINPALYTLQILGWNGTRFLAESRTEVELLRHEGPWLSKQHFNILELGHLQPESVLTTYTQQVRTCPVPVSTGLECVALFWVGDCRLGVANISRYLGTSSQAVSRASGTDIAMAFRPSDNGRANPFHCNLDSMR
jgi:hypothetical protein